MGKYKIVSQSVSVLHVLNNQVSGAEVQETPDLVFGCKQVPQQFDHLLFTIVYVNQILVRFANIITYFELLVTILLTHVFGKVFEVAARYVDHIFLAYRLSAFGFNFSGWALFILYRVFTVKTSVFLPILFL